MWTYGKISSECPLLGDTVTLDDGYKFKVRGYSVTRSVKIICRKPIDKGWLSGYNDDIGGLEFPCNKVIGNKCGCLMSEDEVKESMIKRVGWYQ